MGMTMTGQVQNPGDRTRLVTTGAVVTVAVVVATVVGLLLGPEQRVDAGDMVFIGVLVAASALIWAVVLWAARRPDHANRAAVYGLVMGVVGVIANAAFWTSLPLVFGAGAVVLGRRAQQRAEHGAGRARLARATPILGWVAIGLWVIAYLFVQDFFPQLFDLLG